MLIQDALDSINAEITKIGSKVHLLMENRRLRSLLKIPAFMHAFPLTIKLHIYLVKNHVSKCIYGMSHSMDLRLSLIDDLSVNKTISILTTWTFILAPITERCGAY